MKNVIVTIGEILLGVAIFALVFGPNNSLHSEVTRVFGDVLGQTANVHH